MNPQPLLSLALDLTCFYIKQKWWKREERIWFFFFQGNKGEEGKITLKNLLHQKRKNYFPCLLSSAPATLQTGHGVSLHWNNVQGLIH